MNEYSLAKVQLLINTLLSPKQGSWSEVNPESWTQLNGSNEW